MSMDGKHDKRQQSEVQNAIMKQIQILSEQIEEMRVSMNEQSLIRKQQQQQNSKRNSNKGDKSHDSSTPVISRHVQNLDDKILECELKDAKEDKKVIVSALSNKAKELSKVKPEKPFILVLGNEAHGVSEETIKLADEIVKIDIDNIDSLNVSVAAGILMHYFK